MKLLLWLCIWLGLFIELALGGTMICYGLRNNPNVWSFKYYGGRGIRVCKRWNKFENFLADMGKRPSAKHSVERIKNNRGYSPSNCKWATAMEQGANKTNNLKITAFGETKILSEWARKLHCHCQMIWARLRRGWPAEDAVSFKSRRRRRANNWTQTPRIGGYKHIRCT